MTYLVNNRVYLMDLRQLQSFYHAYQQYHILDRYGIVNTPSTFQEDLLATLNYFNGRLSDDGYLEYIQHTQYDYDIDPSERTLLMDSLYFELERMVRTVIPDYQPHTEVYATYKLGILYIIDKRRQTYVPDTLSYLSSQIDR